MADEFLKVGVVADVSQLVAPLEVGAASAKSAFDKIAASAAEAGNAVLAQAAKFQAQGLSATEASQALAGLGYSASEASKATLEAAATAQELAAAHAEVTVAANAASTAMRSNSASMSEARVIMGALENSTGMMGYGLARIAAESSVLGPLLSAAFPAFAAVALSEILVQMAEAAYHAYENIVLLKSAIDALDKADASAAQHGAELNYQYEESVSRRLQAQGKLTEAAEAYRKAEGDKPLALPKIDDKIFKQFSSDFASFVSSVHSTADAPSVITRINVEAQSTQKQLEAAKQELADLSSANLEGAAGGTEMFSRANKQVEDLTAKLNLLKQMVGDVQSESGIAGNQLETTLAGLDKKAATKNHFDFGLDKQAEAAQKLSDANVKYVETMIDLDAKESTMFAASQDKIGAKSAETAAKEIADSQRAAQAQIKAGEEIAVRAVDAQEAQAEGAKRIADLSIANANTSAIGRARAIDAANQAELEQLREFEKQKAKIELDALDAEQAGMRGGQDATNFLITASPEQLAAYTALTNQIALRKQELNAKLASLDQQSTISSLQATNAIEKQWQSVFDRIDASSLHAFDGIIRGTESVRFAFLRMGGDMVMSVVESFEKMVMHALAGEAAIVLAHTAANQAKVASTAVAAAQTNAISSTSSLKEVTHAAAAAAAKAYEAMAGIPVVGPVLGAAAAAAAFTGVMAFESIASASGGMLVDRDQLAMIHKDERVLPARYSAGLDRMVNSAGQASGGGENHFHISAMDARSFSDFAHRNSKQFTKMLRGSVRNGMRFAR